MRIWRLHTNDQAEWIDARPLQPADRDGSFTFVRSDPSGSARSWEAGQYRVDLLAADRLYSIAVQIPGRFESVPTPDDWPVPTESNLVPPNVSDPSDVRAGPFATVDGGGVPLAAQPMALMSEEVAWRTAIAEAGPIGRPVVATAYLLRATGLGVMLTNHAQYPARGRPSDRAGRPLPGQSDGRRDLEHPGRYAVGRVRSTRGRRMAAGRLCHHGAVDGLDRAARRDLARRAAAGSPRKRGHARRRRPPARLGRAGHHPRPARPPLCCGHAAPPLPQDRAGGAALPPRRRRDPGDHVGDRALAGHQAPDQGLLGVPRHDHGLAAAEPFVRRVSPALPLDRAHPEQPARCRALRLRGHRRRVPQEQRHDHGAALQPDEAKPRRRAGPRPHHRGRRPRHGQGRPRIPGQAGAHLLPRPRLPVRAQRDHRRQGDRLARPGRRRDRHRRPRIGDLPGGRLPAALPAGAPVRSRPDRPYRRIRPGRRGGTGRRAARAGPARDTA